jgi:hypothetical protein
MAKKATPRVLDMSKAESKSGQFVGKIKHYAEGDYKAKIVSVEDFEAESGNDCYLFAFGIKSGLFPYYCVLDPANLWKLRNVFEAAGLKVPSKKAKLDPNPLVGEYVAVTLEDDDYKGKTKSVITSVFPLEDLVDDDDEEEEENTKKAKKKARPVDEEEDEEEGEEEEKPRKKKKKPVEEEEEEDEDEEEEERPRKKKKKKVEEEDEDLEEIDEDDV